MNIGIVDIDLIGRKKHRFPNLSCEKLSGYHKLNGDNVELLTDYNFNPKDYDIVYASKVFTDTPNPDWIINEPNIKIGGTGFHYDRNLLLPAEIEHCKPDYSLYDDWIDKQLRNGVPKSQFRSYEQYSIGFLTRGCFRQCEFCINKEYKQVFEHSPLSEFYDENRKKICLLDDNFFGYKDWKEKLEELKQIGKPFVFKQGLDERLLTDEKCKLLFNSKYDGEFTFAFDNIREYDLIKSKLQLIRKHTDTNRIKFYVLVGFESTDLNDIINCFERIKLLMNYGCIPYIMRYQSTTDKPWQESEFRDMYIQLARWCNQPSLFKKMSFREFCEGNGLNSKPHRVMKEFERKYPEVSEKYFDIKFKKIS